MTTTFRELGPATPAELERIRDRAMRTNLTRMLDGRMADDPFLASEAVWLGFLLQAIDGGGR